VLRVEKGHWNFPGKDETHARKTKLRKSSSESVCFCRATPTKEISSFASVEGASGKFWDFSFQIRRKAKECPKSVWMDYTRRTQSTRRKPEGRKKQPLKSIDFWACLRPKKTHVSRALKEPVEIWNFFV